MRNDRTLIEFCCGPSSLLGVETKHSRGCKVVRLTEEEDVTAPRGISVALEAIAGPCTLLWGSIPCTGGCPWQKINRRRPGGEARLRKHFKLFKRMWKSFEQVARDVLKAGGMVAIEWPKNCAYWKWPCVVALLQELHMVGAMFFFCRPHRWKQLPYQETLEGFY